jgi:hypothetical protein
LDITNNANISGTLTVGNDETQSHNIIGNITVYGDITGTNGINITGGDSCVFEPVIEGYNGLTILSGTGTMMGDFVCEENVSIGGLLGVSGGVEIVGSVGITIPPGNTGNNGNTDISFYLMPPCVINSMIVSISCYNDNTLVIPNVINTYFHAIYYPYANSYNGDNTGNLNNASAFVIVPSGMLLFSLPTGSSNITNITINLYLPEFNETIQTINSYSVIQWQSEIGALSQTLCDVNVSGSSNTMTITLTPYSETPPLPLAAWNFSNCYVSFNFSSLPQISNISPPNFFMANMQFIGNGQISTTGYYNDFIGSNQTPTPITFNISNNGNITIIPTNGLCYVTSESAFNNSETYSIDDPYNLGIPVAYNSIPSDYVLSLNFTLPTQITSLLTSPTIEFNNGTTHAIIESYVLSPYTQCELSFTIALQSNQVILSFYINNVNFTMSIGQQFLVDYTLIPPFTLINQI